MGLTSEGVATSAIKAKPEELICLVCKGRPESARIRDGGGLCLWRHFPHVPSYRHCTLGAYFKKNMRNRLARARCGRQPTAQFPFPEHVFDRLAFAFLFFSTSQPFWLPARHKCATAWLFLGREALRTASQPTPAYGLARNEAGRHP